MYNQRKKVVFKSHKSGSDIAPEVVNIFDI